jgi:alkanesulfonate monooxygenase SsuD/methylene tetrahydromethanopterin reductase-like flavin-dependent oxidoreductase (luciferase family)
MTKHIVGINLWSQASSWPDFLAAAKRVDALGYESLWTWDHLHAIVGDPQQAIFEGYVTLGAWAEATTNVKLGLMVGANTFRNPGLVVKSITTLDHASGGRAILGIGGAWFEYEHTAHGLDFGSGFGQRLDWLDEAVAALRTLLDGATVTSKPGGHYEFQNLHHVPHPLQRHVPIMIGGTGRTKTLRTIARYGDQWNAAGTPELLGELGPILDGYLDEEGRGRDAIERTTNLWMVIRDSEAQARRVWDETMAANVKEVDEGMIADQRPILGPAEKVAARLREYEAVGFTSHILEVPAPYDTETLDRLMGEVLPLVNGG